MPKRYAAMSLSLASRDTFFILLAAQSTWKHLKRKRLMDLTMMTTINIKTCTYSTSLYSVYIIWTCNSKTQANCKQPTKIISETIMQQCNIHATTRSKTWEKKKTNFKNSERYFLFYVIKILKLFCFLLNLILCFFLSFFHLII